jgi:hypothetical protein
MSANNPQLRYLNTSNGQMIRAITNSILFDMILQKANGLIINLIKLIVIGVCAYNKTLS